MNGKAKGKTFNPSLPPVKRKVSLEVMIQRYIADDFQDNDRSQSLWVGNGNDAFFQTVVRGKKGRHHYYFVNFKLKSIQAELDQIYQKMNPDDGKEGAKNQQRRLHQGKMILFMIKCKCHY